MLLVPLIIEELLSCVWPRCGVGRRNRQRSCGVKGEALSQSVSLGSGHRQLGGETWVMQGIVFNDHRVGRGGG